MRTELTPTVAEGLEGLACCSHVRVCPLLEGAVKYAAGAGQEELRGGQHG